MEWTLERAKNSFSEVVRRALAHEPQVVVRGGRADESVVIIAKADYDLLAAPTPTAEFFASSPLARAVREGALRLDDAEDPFARVPDAGRDVGIG